MRTAGLTRFAGALLLLPALVITVGLFMFSLAPTFAFSFYKFVPPASMQPAVVLDNYAAFTHPVYFGYILVTARISLISTVVAMVLGYPLAYTIARTRSDRTRRTLLFAVTTMFFVHTIVRAYAWVAVLGRTGPLSSLLEAVGVGPLRLLSNEFAVTVGTIHWLLPFAIMTLIGPIQSVDPALADASRNLGATELKTFTSVTLPLTFPGIAAASLLALTAGFGMFVGPGQTEDQVQTRWRRWCPSSSVDSSRRGRTSGEHRSRDGNASRRASRPRTYRSLRRHVARGDEPCRSHLTTRDRGGQGPASVRHRVPGVAAPGRRPSGVLAHRGLRGPAEERVHAPMVWRAVP